MRNKETAQTYEMILRELIERIQLGTLNSGVSLPPAQMLAHDLNTGRQNVKNVYQMMAIFGLAQALNGSRSSYQLSDTQSTILQQMAHISLLTQNFPPETVMQVRRMIDEAAFPLMLQNAGNWDADELEQLTDRIRFGTTYESIQADAQAHLWMIHAAGNELLDYIFRMIWDICSTQINLVLENGLEDNRQVQAQTHYAMLRAVRAMDLDMGMKAIRQHYDSIEKELARLKRDKELSA